MGSGEIEWHAIVACAHPQCPQVADLGAKTKTDARKWALAASWQTKNNKFFCPVHAAVK